MEYCRKMRFFTLKKKVVDTHTRSRSRAWNDV